MYHKTQPNQTNLVMKKWQGRLEFLVMVMPQNIQGLTEKFIGLPKYSHGI